MAKLKGVEVEDDHFIVSFRVNKNEYDKFRSTDRHFILVPVEGLNEQLTLGALGNSYRVMFNR